MDDCAECNAHKCNIIVPIVKRNNTSFGNYAHIFDIIIFIPKELFRGFEKAEYFMSIIENI